MIIDLILDRKDGSSYDPRTFYNSVQEYGESFGKIAFDISEKMDNGEEDDVKRALCNYIIQQNYNLNILLFILSVDWL